MNEYVRSKVGPPGIALVILGLGSILANLAFLLVSLVGYADSLVALVTGDLDASYTTTLIGMLVRNLVSLAVSCLASLVVAFAGLRLRGARSPGLIYLGSILAMLPCIGPCCCLGLPIGIWAIVTMQDEQVKAAFAEQF